MALVRAKSTIHLPGNITVVEGTLLEDSHPHVKRYGAWFEPAEASKDHPAETAATRATGKRK